VALGGGRDRICAREALLNMRLALSAELGEIASGVHRLHQAAQVNASAKGASGPARVSAEKMGELARELYRDSRNQLTLAVELADEIDREIKLDDTGVRRGFVRVLRSLPVLNWLAPR